MPAVSPPGKDPTYHSTERCVASRNALDSCREIKIAYPTSNFPAPVEMLQRPVYPVRIIRKRSVLGQFRLIECRKIAKYCCKFVVRCCYEFNSVIPSETAICPVSSF